jgi:uncharacterized protein (TIGR00730 family)
MNDSNERKEDQPTISLADEDGVTEVLVDTVFSLWEVVNNLTRLRPSKRDRYRATIFGSARARPGTFVYDEVKRIASSLADLGCEIITGGGPGLMQAANEGASQSEGDGPARSVGIRVDLPFEQDVNPFVERAFDHGTFFTRLHHFALASDAFIVTPGGIGTVLETMMIWQLRQVGHLPDLPLILVGNMWPELIEWHRKRMLQSDPPLVNAEDLEIPTCVETADEAIALVAKDHARWLAANAT